MAATATHAVNEIYRVAKLFVGLITPIVMVLYFAATNPANVSNQENERSERAAAEFFDSWLALSGYFQSSNRVVFPAGSWDLFIEKISNASPGQTISEIDVVKEVNSGTEVISPQPISITLPYATASVSDLKLTVKSQLPPVLSISSSSAASKLADYELIYYVDRDRIYVVPEGLPITDMRQAANALFGDKLARPKLSEEIIQGLRRHGWAATLPDFQDLSAGHDIVRTFMSEALTEPKAPEAPTIKIMGLELPVSWLGIALQACSLVVLVLLIVPVATLVAAVFKRKAILIDEPEKLPMMLQEHVLRVVASLVPLNLAAGTAAFFFYVKDRLPIKGGLLDYGTVPALVSLAIVWGAVVGIAHWGHFEFKGST
jgi:hypothetical protein